MRQELMALLKNDAALVNLLTGGIYDGAEVDHISRTTTPGAYDSKLEQLPCMIVKFGSEAPFGPLRTVSRVGIVLYLYQRTGSDVIDRARERCYYLLHRQRLNGVRGWEMEHGGDVMGQWDAALDCPMILSRYRLPRHRVEVEPPGATGQLDFSKATQSSLVGVV